MGWLAALDPLPVWIVTAWLAVLMLQAGGSKVKDRLLLVQHLSAYRVPTWALAPLSVLLPWAEIVAGVGLITPWRPGAAAACAGLLGVYAAAMAWHLRAGRELDCGCGGEPLPLSWALVGRNVLLLLLCWPASLPMSDRALHWGDRAVIVGAVVLGVLIWAVFHQVLRQTRRSSWV